MSSSFNIPALCEQLHRAAIAFDRMDRAIKHLDNARQKVGKDRVECKVAEKIADDVHFHMMDKYLTILQTINSQVSLQACTLETLVDMIEQGEKK